MISWGGFSRDFASANDSAGGKCHEQPHEFSSHSGHACRRLPRGLQQRAPGRPAGSRESLRALAPPPPGGQRAAVNPYAPWRSHAYRHGAVPTRETVGQMRAWRASMQLRGAPVVPQIMICVVGIEGIAVPSGPQRVYLVFYGSQWTSGRDPQGAATYLQNLFKGIGTG